MKARLATIITILALVGGTGGALALAGSGSGSTHGQSAAGSEYKPGKHCGHHQHRGHHYGERGFKPCPHPTRHHGDGDGDGGGDGLGHHGGKKG